MKKVVCPLFRSAVISVCLLLSAFHSLLSTRYLLLSTLYAQEVDIKTKIKELKSADQKVRVEAVELLGKSRDRNFIPYLKDAVKDKSARVRMKAILALAEMKDSSVTPTLLETLKDPETDVRLHSVVALGEITDQTSLPYLAELVSKKEQPLKIRLACANALGHFPGNESAVESLIETLKDEDPWLRMQCVESLARLGGDKAIKTLKETAKGDKDEKVKGVAQKSLEYLGIKE